MTKSVMFAGHGAVKRSIRMGTVLKIWIGTKAEIAVREPEIEKEIQKALEQGRVVEENGMARWIRWQEVLDTSKVGSAMYEWKGDKTKWEKFVVSKNLDTGNIVQSSLGFFWKEWT